MNTKTILAAVLLLIAINGMAQKPIYPKPGGSDQIPFGKKLPPPVMDALSTGIKKAYDPKFNEAPYRVYDKALKQNTMIGPRFRNLQMLSPQANRSSSSGKPPTTGKVTASNFHLTKDINTLSESEPSNYPLNTTASFAVLNNVSYFTADDGVHGRELWRSDGTANGTYLVKDINPGVANAFNTPSEANIIAANGLLFFSATTADNGKEPWVSDGTPEGTHLLKDINAGIAGSYADQYVLVNGAVFFSISLNNYYDQLWKTDGTDAGTTFVKDLLGSGIGYGDISELTAANGLAYFIAYTYNSGFQLFRSDGTDAGTYVVKEIGYFNFGADAPTQLTSYNNSLYFSGNDGSGRRLWVTDGTTDGTTYAPGFNDVLLQPDYVNPYSNTPFPIFNNVLYLSGFTYADGSGLYKYDASTSDGIVLVKDLTSGTDIDFVVPIDMRVINNVLYFKVINSTGNWHDELWSSLGETATTQLIKSFVPGEYIYSIFGGGSTVYFGKYDTKYGNELWKTNGTVAGTTLVKDINPGKIGSFPNDLTVCNGNLLFSAANINTGIELWTSNGTENSTVLVKDINTTSTRGSEAGFFYKGLSATPTGVVFNAFTSALGGELYKSDGTSSGTVLLNDIAPGEDWSFPNAFLYKNNVSYFIGDNVVGTALYKTNGTTAGLQRITAYINRDYSDAHPDNYAVVNFNITDDGQAFYILFNRYQGRYELWHSNGTASSGELINANLNYNDYTVMVNNTAYFVAGDFDHGFELWKSDGTPAGTKMVKDIYSGVNGSSPYSLFAYKNQVYFGAYDGFGFSYELWKSDGTEKGTVKLKNITPLYFSENFIDPPVPVFCVSNSTLYFSGFDYNTYGAELWKTNGTEAGTKLIKDINPYNSSFPNNLTDVKGTLYFTADDGIHGTELWMSNGTEGSTRQVKDITPGYNYSNYFNFCSAGGKLYFLNGATYPATLWSSDGTETNTRQVTDAGLNGVSNFSHLTGAGNLLFFGAYSPKYGDELYAGDASASPFVAAPITANRLATPSILPFDAVVYPNPSSSGAVLRINGNEKISSATITDAGGKTIWQERSISQNTISLPVETVSAGAYLITVSNGTESKTLTFIKK